MSGWRPLFSRDKPNPRLDQATEGLPPYLLGPVTKWIRRVCYDPAEDVFRESALQTLQLRFKLETPLNFGHPGSAVQDLIARSEADEDFGLELIDYLLHHMPEYTDRYEDTRELAAVLQSVLRLGGSAWEVVPVDGLSRAFRLSRRAVGPVREAILAVPASTRAHQHLVEAWNRLSGRQPDPSGAYREAVRAVEAAAKPVILPLNDKATLGTMIAAMRDKPEKWESTLVTVDEVRGMLAQVWTNQLDRHGTDDDSVPLNMTPDQADVAVHLALALVRIFVGGHLRPAGQATVGASE
jgi:hypothetical protein